MDRDKFDRTPKKIEPSSFDGLMKMMNDFFYGIPPMKYFLENFDDFLTKPFITGIPIDTYESNNEFIIEAKLPGIKREQIQLDINNHYMTITVNNSETINQVNDKDQTFHKSHSYQHLRRTIALPYPVINDKIKASFNNGLLEIRIPIQKNKRIEIE